MEKEIQDFIRFFTRQKGLTKAQQARFHRLLARDCAAAEAGPEAANTPSKDAPARNAADNAAESPCRILTRHEPQTVVAFLHQFTESKTKALKFTTHYWDKNPETGEYDFPTFRDLKNACLDILNHGDRPLESIRLLCPPLWQTVRNFLVNDEAKYPWGEYRLKVGYHKYLETWMDAHPGEQPFSMPLDLLAEEIRPQSLDGKTMVYFGDVVNVFKQSIEFRDNDLFHFVRRTFSSSDFSLDAEALRSLRGRAFYTYTASVKEALKIIAGNISCRSQFKDLHISCRLLRQGRQEYVQLRILQKESFSRRETSDPKVRAQGEEGDFCRIKALLQNLCDFSVESLFRVDGEEKHCRINYLLSPHPVEGESCGCELLPGPCPGFTYVLTFYTYLKDE